MKFPDWLKLIKGDLNKDDDEEIEMALHEPIGFNGWDGMSARRFGETLNSIPRNKKMVLTINTLGGNIDEGIAMHNMLLARGKVTTRVIGYAASMGSVIAQAGAVRQMMPGTMMIIHDPMASVDGGTSEEMAKQSAFLKLIKGSLVDLYQARTGAGKKLISEMMSETTAMDAKAAKELGFIDEIVEGSPAWNEIRPISLFNFLRDVKAEKPQEPVNIKPKSMKLLIAALAKLKQLPADITDELAAPQVETAVTAILGERDQFKNENLTLKNEIEGHKAALKTRVTNRVQKAIDAKLIKAERKDALIAAGITNEASLDFLEDIAVVPPGQRRGAPPIPPAEGGPETLESLRAEMRKSGSDETDVMAVARNNSENARKLRKLRGHENLFTAAVK